MKTIVMSSNPLGLIAAVALLALASGCAGLAPGGLKLGVTINEYADGGAPGSAAAEIESTAVALWLDDAEAAVSFTFDDNNRSQYENIAPLLEEYSFRGSFFVNPGIFETPARRHHETWNDTKDGYREIALRGHEIGNHTWSHANLIRLKTREEIIAQVTRPLDVIEADIGVRPVSFVHPFNKSNATVDEIVFSHHLFARISSVHPASGRIRAPIGSNRHKRAFPGRFKKALERNAWLTISGHGALGVGWQPISQESLHAACRMIAESDRNIFVGTLAEVGAYEHIRREIEIEISGAGEDLRLNFAGFDAERYAPLPRAPITFLLFRNGDSDQSEPPLLYADGEPLRFQADKNAYIGTIDLKRKITVLISTSCEE